MANTLLPIEERSLTPDEVELLDKRRRRGQLCLVLCFQSLIIRLSGFAMGGAGLTATLSPGWMHPMVYWDALMFGAAAVFGFLGVSLKAREQRVHQLLTLAD